MGDAIIQHFTHCSSAVMSNVLATPLPLSLAGQVLCPTFYLNAKALSGIMLADPPCLCRNCIVHGNPFGRIFCHAVWLMLVGKSFSDTHSVIKTSDGISVARLDRSEVGRNKKEGQGR